MRVFVMRDFVVRVFCDDVSVMREGFSIFCTQQ